MKALKPELLVRKKISRFIEKLFQYQNADISHDRFKSIMYGEVGTDSLLEEKLIRFKRCFKSFIATIGILNYNSNGNKVNITNL